MFFALVLNSLCSLRQPVSTFGTDQIFMLCYLLVAFASSEELTIQGKTFDVSGLATSTFVYLISLKRSISARPDFIIQHSLLEVISIGTLEQQSRAVPVLLLTRWLSQLKVVTVGLSATLAQKFRNSLMKKMDSN